MALFFIDDPVVNLLSAVHSADRRGSAVSVVFCFACGVSFCSKVLFAAAIPTVNVNDAFWRGRDFGRFVFGLQYE